MTQLDERGVKVIDARNKHHGGIRPGDVVEHPEHGKGVVQHLDHVHDEVVYKNHEGSFIGVHHSTLKKMNEMTESKEPGKDSSHFDHYLYHFRKSIEHKDDDDTSKTHKAKAQEFLNLHTQKSRKNPKQKVAVTEVKNLKETMDKNLIVQAILSKDETRLSEAKTAIKAMLTARATQFRDDSAKFVAQSLFESQLDEAVHADIKAARAIVARHHAGKAQKDTEGSKGDTIHAVHSSKRQDLHNDLVKAGFKHSENEIVHEYHKGKARVAVAKETGGDDRYNDTPDDHHETGVGHSYNKD